MSTVWRSESFIPVSVTELVTALCEDRGPDGQSPLSETDRLGFRHLADLAAAQVHARYLCKLKLLKASYAPFDPDCDLVDLPPLSPEAAERSRDALFSTFAELMLRANYQRLTRDDLTAAMQGASAWGVEMTIAWEAFERLDVYVRGTGTGTRRIRKWYRLFRSKEVSVPTFRRVAIVLKQQPHPQLGRDADTHSIFMKHFKDIPCVDIEMLLPGTRIRMAILDRLKLSGSGVGSIGYVLWKLSSMSLGGIASILSGSLFGWLALYTPLALIFGYGYRTYASFNNTRKSYMLQLSQSLYFQNLDNNAGVLYRLLDSAEEQETRELLLGYYFLWRGAGTPGWTRPELDRAIEQFLQSRFGIKADFEVNEALEKLKRMKLLRPGEENREAVIPLADAIAQLEQNHDREEPFIVPQPGIGVV